MQLSQTTRDQLDQNFIEEYWQKKSLFIPQAFESKQGFIDSIDVDELAGLALEEDIESRLIQQTKPEQLTFDLSNGPFTEAQLTSLPASNWTLLIQAVDHYLEQFQQLKLQFDFIPSWRLDDVMVSISPQGGTVGPHFDQYDVFLIQANGSREWKIGQHCNQHTELVPDNTLSIINNFEPTDSYSCEVGDIIYIPPGISHWGTATSNNCVTISIGFRAPSYQEIIDDICLEACSTLTEDQRFKDSPASLNNTRQPALIDDTNLEKIQQQLEKLLLDKQLIAERFNAIMSQAKYDEAFTFIDTDEATAIYQDTLSNKTELSLRSDSRINYSLKSSDKNNSQEVIIGLNGQTFTLNASECLSNTIEQLSQFEPIQSNNIDHCASSKILIIKAISLDAIEIFDE